MHLVGMDTLLILLSLGPGYHHPRGQDITQDNFSRGLSSPRRKGAGPKLSNHTTYLTSLLVYTVIFREDFNRWFPTI
jgi:hypothetical protein